MAKIYVQNFPTVFQSSASFLSTACPSGSAISNGYARIIGVAYAGCTMDAASGISVYQSADGGSNWDYVSQWSLSASSGSAFSIEIVGDAVKVIVRSSTCNVNPFRTLWQLRPV